MGLDVYLKHYTDRGASQERERLYSERAEALSARKLSDDQKETERRRVAAELNLTEWGDDELNEKVVQLDSAIDVEHYFKVGYFRSAYNEAGINNYTRRVLGVRGLYAIFPESEGGEHEFQPDWGAAKQRALEMAAALQDHAASQPYDVVEVRHKNFVDPQSLPMDPHAALEVFKANAGNKAHGSFGCRDGEFFLDKPLAVRAAIPGTCRRMIGGDRLEPAVYLVFDAPNHHEWYVTALRIVAETCDYVLKQPDAAKYWLWWSA